jgi:hypothetical protein
MKTVKELLEELSREVNQLTDLRKKYKVNVKGQRVEGIKIINAFDEDMRAETRRPTRHLQVLSLQDWPRV